MNRLKFPWIRVGSLLTILIGISSAIAIETAQYRLQTKITAMFNNIVELTAANINANISMHDNLVIVAQQTPNDIQKNATNNIFYYLSKLPNKPAGASYYVLPKIYPSELENYEKSKQEDGFLNFHIYGNPDGDPLSSNLLYFPTDVVYLDHIAELKHLGRDVYSYPLFHETIDMAVKTNSKQAAWSHVTADNLHGISIFSPIYAIHQIGSIDEQRRMDLLQVMIVTELNIDKIVRASLLDLETLKLPFDLQIKTLKQAKQARISHIYQLQHEIDRTWLPQIHLNKTIYVLDKPVTLSLNIAIPFNALPWGIIALIIGIALFMVAVAFYLFRHYYYTKYENKLIYETLQRERDLAQTTLTSLGEGVITVTLTGHIQYANPKACEIIQYHDDLEGVKLVDIWRTSQAEDKNNFVETLNEVIEHKQPAQKHNLKLLNRYNDQTLIDATFSPIRGSLGEISGVAIVLEDVTYLEDMRQQIENMAKRDHLTGLWNRYEFEQQLKNAITQANKQHLQHAFCYLDLDQFKIVNDTAGHMAGDQLLRQLAGTVLLRNLPETAILGRLGGDEFGLILLHTNATDALKVCQQIILDIQHFIFLWQEKRFQVGVSIGLAMITEHTLSLEQILIAADTACYLAKEKGRNRVELAHVDNMEIRQRQEELSWAERIPYAINEDRFVLFIQRILPISTHQIHMEVLVRMYDEYGKLLSPGQFIPAAERYGLMVKIDRWVIEKALNNIHYMIESKLETGMVYSINLSGQTLADEKFLHFIHERLTERPHLAKHLCFEITETAAMGNMAQALTCMRLLKQLGASLALDDFGSGLSSFAYLRQMPVDYLKIDGVFVKNIHKDMINRAIVANIHHLATVFNLKTVAEYVENEDILNILKDIGVDFAQGYAIHVPEPWLLADSKV